MQLNKLEFTQIMNTTLDEAWSFFSRPENLRTITPSDLDFTIISDVPEKMYEGLLIEYKVRPMLGLRTKWVSKITNIKEKEYFIDEQVSGPYKLWHHQHFFRQTGNKVEMKDIVHYAIPFSPISTIFINSIVKKKLIYIFEFRKKKIEEIFPSKSSLSK